jgi:hypothetical protein
MVSLPGCNLGLSESGFLVPDKRQVSKGPHLFFLVGGRLEDLLKLFHPPYAALGEIDLDVAGELLPHQTRHHLDKLFHFL